MTTRQRQRSAHLKAPRAVAVIMPLMTALMTASLAVVPLWPLNQPSAAHATTRAQTHAQTAQSPRVVWSTPGDASAGMLLAGVAGEGAGFSWVALTNPAATSTSFHHIDPVEGTSTLLATQAQPGWVRSFELEYAYDDQADEPTNLWFVTILEEALADGRSTLTHQTTTDGTTTSSEVDGPAFRDVETSVDGPLVGWIEFSDATRTTATKLGIGELGFNSETSLDAGSLAPGEIDPSVPVVFSRAGLSAALPRSPSTGLRLFTLDGTTLDLPAPALSATTSLELAAYDIAPSTDQEAQANSHFLYRTTGGSAVHMVDGSGATLATTDDLSLAATPGSRLLIGLGGETVLALSTSGETTTIERWNVAVDSVDSFSFATPDPTRTDGGILSVLAEHNQLLVATGTTVELLSLDGGPTSCSDAVYDDAETFGQPNHYAPETLRGPQLTDVVRRSYLLLLGREPDPDALAYWRHHLALGGRSTDIVATIRTSPEFAAAPSAAGHAVTSPIGIFTLLCERIFGGVPDSASFEHYPLADAGYTNSSVASLINGYEAVEKTNTATPLAGSRVNAVWRLYGAYFQRDADTDGLNYWYELAYAGMDLAEISGYFEQSREFDLTYGALSDRAFVELLYRNVFDRVPDDEGWDYWVSILGQGHTRGTVMLNFSNSAEFILQTDTLP